VILFITSLDSLVYCSGLTFSFLIVTTRQMDCLVVRSDYSLSESGVGDGLLMVVEQPASR